MTPRRGLLAACAVAFSSAAGAAVYPMPPAGEDLVGDARFVEAQAGDTLATIAFQYGVGFRALLHANRELDPWKLRPHQRVELPTRTLLPPVREGIVVNIPEMRLFYFPADGKRVFVYPVGVGRVDWKTPTGETEVTKKVRNPNWYVPVSIQREHAEQGDPLPPVVLAGDPENPLGTLAMRLGWPDVLIHGTNKPLGGIGMPVTHGCIRLYSQDIEELFNNTAVGTKVTIIDEPYKLGRHQGKWFLEAHSQLTEDAHAPTAEVTPGLVVKLKTNVTAKRGVFDWNRVAAVLKRADGLPTPLNPPTIAPPALAATSPELAMAEASGGATAVRNGPYFLLAAGPLVVLGLLAAGRRWRGFRRRDVGR